VFSPFICLQVCSGHVLHLGFSGASTKETNVPHSHPFRIFISHMLIPLFATQTQVSHREVCDFFLVLAECCACCFGPLRELFCYFFLGKFACFTYVVDLLGIFSCDELLGESS
jgi:hypothetical protein